MPSPREVSLYQVGIRLTQVEYLHNYLTQRTDADPVDLDSLWRTLRFLEQAFEQFAETESPDSPVVSAGRALIGECRRLWKEWSGTIAISDLPQSDVEFCEVTYHLARIEELLNEMLADDATAVTWFALGREISQRQWKDPNAPTILLFLRRSLEAPQTS